MTDYHIPDNITKIVSRNIYFDFNPDKIKVSSYPSLERILNILNDEPNASLQIVGHTDNVGSEENNMLVSEMRSKAILKFLIAKGINPDRIVSEGRGESQPLVSNDDEFDGREINRRIEFIFRR